MHTTAAMNVCGQDTDKEDPCSYLGSWIGSQNVNFENWVIIVLVVNSHLS